MKFVKYPDIKNAIGSGSKKTINKFFYEGCIDNSLMWCNTEKIHGSNLTIFCDGDKVVFWTRKRVLSDKEDFYNYFRIKDDLVERTKETYKYIKENMGLENFEINICGELFGGNYPHGDVEKIKGVKGIQKGVYYHPDIKFYVFDLKIDGKFINYNKTCLIMEKNGFHVAFILFEGTFSECMKYPNDFQTTISKYYGLPDIEGNICEGWVLKPIETMYLHNGNRVILKNRNSKFDERGKPIKIKKIPQMSEEGIKVWGELSSFITQQRLFSVLSKIDLSLLAKKTVFGTIMKDFIKDVIDSFNEACEGWLDNLDAINRKLVGKALGMNCVPLVRKEYLEYLES